MEWANILTFWFEELTPTEWFQANPILDQSIREKYGDLYIAVCAGLKQLWRESPEGALAEILVLDQFSRNIHRDTPQAFSMDEAARVLAREAMERGDDMILAPLKRQFMYMPFMHSEDRGDHELALTLFTALGNEHALRYEKMHNDIIDRFGRYPHRNIILGRTSTSEEIEFLKNGQGF